MNTELESPWFLDLNEKERSFASIDLLLSAIDQAEGIESGRLWAGEDGGPQPWWQKLFGGNKRYVDALFSVEFYKDTASLIFHDENWSEYRAIDKKVPVNVNQEVRLKIAHGELNPHPIEECMEKDRAFKAIKEYLKTGSRPSWMEYHYVG